jgi:hypothetical protein
VSWPYTRHTHSVGIDYEAKMRVLPERPHYPSYETNMRVLSKSSHRSLMGEDYGVIVTAG